MMAMSTIEEKENPKRVERMNGMEWFHEPMMDRLRGVLRRFHGRFGAMLLLVSR
jgi:N-formylglutamate amidohydrolase